MQTIRGVGYRLGEAVAENRVRRRFGAVGLRTTAAATVVVAVALASVAQQRAVDIATRVGTNDAAVELSGGAGEQAIVQVVAPDGDVVASSEAVAGEPPVVGCTPAPGQRVTRRIEPFSHPRAEIRVPGHEGWEA